MKRLLCILLGVLAIVLLYTSGHDSHNDAADYPPYSSYVSSDSLSSMPVALCSHTVTAPPTDSTLLFLEDQYFMAENDIAHGVMLHMYETMDPSFPPKGSIHWKDGKHYNAQDIIWEERSYGPYPTMTYKVQVLRKGAKPLKPSNPFERELYGY